MNNERFKNDEVTSAMVSVRRKKVLKNKKILFDEISMRKIRCLVCMLQERSLIFYSFKTAEIQQHEIIEEKNLTALTSHK